MVTKLMLPSTMMRVPYSWVVKRGLAMLFGVGGIGCFDVEARVGLGEKGVQRNGGRGPSAGD